MANRTKFLHFKTSAGFYAEIERNSGLSGDAALKATNNGCFYFICFIQETDQIYTHGNLYNCSEFDNTDLQDQINVINESLENKANKSELEENERVIAAALTDFNNTKADRSEIPDSSSFATRDDLNILSANFNNLDANKITSGTISIERLPVGALERLFVVASESAAMSVTVQEGDVVQVTGNSNKMYFCISNTATTFGTKFKEFTAGTATSVPWSGVTGKPTGIDGWGDRIGVIESGYATQSWVGENYLSNNGGTMVKGAGIFNEADPSTVYGAIGFNSNHNAFGSPFFPTKLRSSIDVTLMNSSEEFTLLHTGNYSTLLAGGSVNGSITANGNMYALDFVTTSDNRLKDFISDIYVDFESIKQIPKKYYYWKDKSMGEDLQLGTSAQELAKIYPECVHYDETNDRYSVNYQKLSIVALAAIDKLHDRVSELESKLYDKNN